MNLHEVFLASGMMGGSEENYVHIETIDVMSDGVSMLKRTNEPDGTPYNFKKVLVRLITPRCDVTAAGQININSSYPILWRDDIISSTGDSVSCMKAEIKNGMLEGFCLLTDDISGRAVPYYRSDTLFSPCESIETITVFIDPMSVNLPIGSSVEIYAVRN
ncbi:MAG: hypothetical protein IKV85_10670 [Ruminococcus sp.]|nr:hypothetical protein [Ruminococcus sp.]